MNDDAIRQAVAYHETTKHDFQRAARGPGYMDWATQPDPFRRFEGAPLIYLPLIVRDESPPYQKLFQAGVIPPSPLTLYSISRFFELSLAVSAWKQSGESRWALRSNPSSGNLHPTEGYLLAGPCAGLHTSPGVYHYAAREHALERRAEFETAIWNGLMHDFPENSFLVGLSSIHWRESWKYGERAFRYCQHDIGHALAAYRVAAAVLGWNMVLLEDMDDASISSLFGLDRKEDFENGEREHPDLTAVIFPSSAMASIPLSLAHEMIRKVAQGNWTGKANRLSIETRPWDVIDHVSDATLKPVGDKIRIRELPQFPSKGTGFISNSPRRSRTTARQIIRQRRSAVAFDGVTHLSSDEFYDILTHAIHDKKNSNMPWDMITWSPRIHLCLFVHRVHGLEPGLYFLVRDPDKLELIQNQVQGEFLWRKPVQCPIGINLYLLKEGNYQGLAAQVSCTQEIAGKSAFSLGMVAEFLPSLKEFGGWFYRRLFWESGMVGQMLYLAAEHAGIRSTGIGCYFDDPVHQILGLEDNTLQSLYHFTIGGAVEDKRLSSFPAYVWSCEAPGGRFVSRTGLAAAEKMQSKVNSIPASAVVSWKYKSLARIGAGLRGMVRQRKEHRESLHAILSSPINVIETSPAETGGEDEFLLGDLMNAGVEADQYDPEQFFFITRLGLIIGVTGRLVDEMDKRRTPFREIISIDFKRRLCLHPDYLEDQMNRSLHRLGLEAMDLVLIEIPQKLFGIIGEEEGHRRIREACRALQKECDRGRVGGFGLSAPGFTLPGNDAHCLSLEKIHSQIEDLAGFSAVEFPANFIDNGAFKNLYAGENLVARARKLGLLVIAGKPLRGQVNGEQTLLVDYPKLEKRDAEVTLKGFLDEAWAIESEILETVLADGRILREVLQGAGIPSPFNLRNLIKPFLQSNYFSSDQWREMNQAYQENLMHVQNIGEQLVNAQLWEIDRSIEVLNLCEHQLDRVSQHLKENLRQKKSIHLHSLRQRHFPGQSQVPLQILGLNWLLEQGVDIVLNNMRHRQYVNEALEALQGLK